MNIGFSFFFQSILLGIGLAMDAFSAALANGLGEPEMKRRKICGVAGIFATFQFAMPMIGWVCVSTAAQYFSAFAVAVPWIALALLSFLGGKMLYEGTHHQDGGKTAASPVIGLRTLLLQGVATSIDALSVGFTISEHSPLEALLACLLIGLVTFAICVCGIAIGKRAGTHLAGKAGIFGGLILILIGIEIFITGVFF